MTITVPADLPVPEPLVPTDLPALRAAVTGPVLVPGDPGLADEITPFNLAARHRPDVVVAATSTADVAAAVGWAAASRLPVAVQATGHGAEVGVAGGLLITTGRMRSVSVDPVARTARIAAGARWADVIAAAAPHGLAPLSGSSPDVGAVGYLLGGGLPILGRAFGFGADLVRSCVAVTADGRVRQVDAGSEPELFWALRGGRGAFAVVTEMTLDLLPLRSIYGGLLLYPGDAAPAVLHRWREWVATLPDETCTSVAIMRFPDAPFVPEPLRGRCVVALRVAHVGPAEEGARLLAPMRTVAPLLEDAVTEMPYAASAAIYRDPTTPVPSEHRGATLRELPVEAVDALLAVAGPQAASPLVVVELRHLGGALAREPRIPNAVPARDAAFNLLTRGVLVPPVVDAIPAAAQAVHAALSPWAARGCLLTFLGAADTDAMADVWPEEVYARLRRVKADYDPHEVFRQGHRIPPAPFVPRPSEAVAAS
ncbi:FAD-binding oxidoreductase [Blastococcus deserti]|uniref:FAD-binding oxidoreductase n=1 Tax=Blastococcus deserti TaxID=2259033 RepID=A0ABW4X6M3_9ACTN